MNTADLNRLAESVLMAGWQVDPVERRLFRDPDSAEAPHARVSSFALYCLVKKDVHDRVESGDGVYAFPFFVAPEPLPLQYVLFEGWTIDETDLAYLIGPPGGPPIFHEGVALELGAPGEQLDLQEACALLDVDETLLRWLMRYGFNSRKLVAVAGSVPFFERSEVDEFARYLSAPWPGTGRRPPPAGVRRYIRLEASGRCQQCRQEKPNYEWAHVDAWARTRNNSPHNLLMLCLDCHRSHGNDEAYLRDVKSAARRSFRLLHEQMDRITFEGIQPGSRLALVDHRSEWRHENLLVNMVVDESGTVEVDLPSGCECLKYRVRKGSNPPFKPLEGLAYPGRLQIRQEPDW